MIYMMDWFQFSDDVNTNFFINFIIIAVIFIIAVLTLKGIICKIHNVIISKRVEKIEYGIAVIKKGMTKAEVLSCFRNLKPNKKSRNVFTYSYNYWRIGFKGDVEEGNIYTLTFDSAGILISWSGTTHKKTTWVESY